MNYVTPSDVDPFQTQMLTVSDQVGSAPTKPRLPFEPAGQQLRQISEERKSYAEPEADLG